MYFGACYYPEHWPEERWETDAEMMKAAGFNIVRLAEFAWSKIERYEGTFDFSWLDRIISLLGNQGIKVILGTPSATPPKWLMDQHNEIYMRDMYGHVRGFGNRRHYCYSSDIYQTYVDIIVDKMARHYAGNPNVVAWQTDNEFGCNDTTRCYCDNCLSKFQAWLKRKYTEIDSLNDTYGTVFWSQIYNSFEEVVLPAFTVFPLHNPSLVLDYRRFASDSVIDFQKKQIDIIRALAPHQSITHNMMGAFNEIDCYDLSADLDIASWDNYPNLMFTKEVNPALAAMQHDMTRGLKQHNFWVMEHQSGQPGGNIMFPTPKPQELRRWTYQSIAHGADGILYFRWRGCLFGAEQYWHGILNHDGKPGRKYREVQEVGNELARISAIIEGSVNKAKVAIVRSYDNEWVFEIQPHVMHYSYMEHFTRYYQYFYDKNIQVDIISPDFNFSEYSLVVLPNYIMATDELVEKVNAYVRLGGNVIFDFRAGAKDWNNRMEPLTLPGKFAELLGLTVEEYGVLNKGESRKVAFGGVEGSFTAETWFDVIKTEQAEVLATFDEDYFAGCPVVTKNRYGQGHAFYIGSDLEPALMELTLDEVCKVAETEASHGISAPKGIELVSRNKAGQAYIFVINHTVLSQTIQLHRSFEELLGESVLQGEVVIEGNGVLILAGAKEQV
ncbi:beta-galactosidase [Paenibacillus psychroresistens]|uniref:Beta-galactosidase n=1 Tax=Paenibacillus psychroresistens TaxID=1778678 RepID=A0A6B8RIV7_9BACL|nr:beta-galactosidase [Paenibacillus psychroresistens]QGQ95545.1 beta-galactosidase [Paenibacillus psychroresistens]